MASPSPTSAWTSPRQPTCSHDCTTPNARTHEHGDRQRWLDVGVEWCGGGVFGMATTAMAVAAATTRTPVNTAAEPDWIVAAPIDRMSPGPKIEFAIAPNTATPTA